VEQLSAWTTAEILNIPHDKEAIKNFIVDIQKHSDQAVKYNTNNHSFDSLREIIIDYVNEGRPALGPGIYKEYIKNKHNKLYLTALFMGPTLSGAASMSSALEFLTLDLFRTNTLGQVVNDRSLIPNAVNESLRYHASTGRFSRTVLKEVELHGITMKPGDRVALCLDSANRDPAKFSEPDKFRISRDTTGIAFGHGVHACIALAITKAAMNVYLNVLLDEMGKYTILTGDSDLEYLIPASGNNDMITNIILSTDK
jgi:cytochrome P450